jgi:hypothetical protein
MQMTEIQGVAKEIMKQLEYYVHDVKQNVDEAKQETAKEMIAELKQTSPEKRPSYKKGWKIKKTSKSVIVHNATDYQLTHLLEYGHPVKGGGRDTDAAPHIRPAEEKGIRKYLNKVERAIKP